VLRRGATVAREEVAGPTVANAPHDDDVFRNGKLHFRGGVCYAVRVA
jgi:hypothetical protein